MKEEQGKISILQTWHHLIAQCLTEEEKGHKSKKNAFKAEQLSKGLEQTKELLKLYKKLEEEKIRKLKERELLELLTLEGVK